jgi:hypothetical protein
MEAYADRVEAPGQFVPDGPQASNPHVDGLVRFLLRETIIFEER